MTARTIITAALVELGVLSPGDTADASTAASGLAILQRIVDSLGAERQAIFQLLRTTKTLTSGTRDYTIGSGGDINIVRPAWIDHAAIVLDTTATDPIEYPLDLLSDGQWAALPIKTLDAGLIEAIYYDRAMSSTSRGTISTFPTINISATQLVIYTPKALTGFVDLSTVYVFPPGYQEAFHFELAYQCQRPFGRALDPEIKEQRGEAWARAKRQNLSLTELSLDPMFAGGDGYYDITVDG